jgi:pentatricopeptide repeat protein
MTQTTWIKQLLIASLLATSDSFFPSCLHRLTSAPHIIRENNLFHVKPITTLCAKSNKPVQAPVKKKKATDVIQNGPQLKTKQDFIDQFEALKYLSEEAPDEDLPSKAQDLFDTMFNRWFENDNDDLEPDTKIYNLLICIYANCGNMVVAEKILNRMETGQTDFVPEPDTETYELMMKGWSLNGDLDKAEEVLDRVQNKHHDETENDNGISQFGLYNAFLEILKRSEEEEAGQRAEVILDRMITNQESNVPSPNVESFTLALSCIIRNSRKIKSSIVRQKVRSLIGRMNAIENVNPNHKDIVNLNIKSLADISRSEAVAFEAESLLFDLMELYEKTSSLEERPSASIFINTIHAWKNVKCDEARVRALELLNLLKEFYRIELDRGLPVEDLKPDHRVYNACMDVIARGKSDNKGIESLKLLQEMKEECEKFNDNALAPNLRSYNNVINACAFTKGNEAASKNALRVMFDTFKEMQKSENCQPNQATYGLLLKGCFSLIADESKRENLAEKVFRACCKAGYCSDFVVESFELATSSSFVESVLGGDLTEGVRIPEDWRCNLK